MRKITGAAFVSLDGVMQAPGGPTEDWTCGFEYGGWLAGLFDEAVGHRIDRLFGGQFDLLLGRRTYDVFSAFRPFAGDDQKVIETRSTGPGNMSSRLATSRCRGRTVNARETWSRWPRRQADGWI
jgi:dihydrofolate reductase